MFSSFSVSSDTRGAGKPVDSLIVLPSRYEYPVGAVFDPADLKVFAVYTDGATEEIPPGDFTVSGDTDFDTPGEKVITVEYGGKAAQVTLTVRSQTGSGDNAGGGGSEDTPSVTGSSIDLKIKWTK
jgi:hypothetical protein